MNDETRRKEVLIQGEGREGEIVQSTVPAASASDVQDDDANETPTERAAKLLQGQKPKQGIELDNEDG